MMKSLLKPRSLLVSLATLSLSATYAAVAQTPLSVNKAVETALSHNPGYQSVSMGVDIARLELGKATAARLPTLDLRGGYTRYSDPMIVVPIHETGVFPSLDRDIITTGLYAQMPLYTGGRMDASGDLARAQIEGSKQLAESMKQDLVFSVVRTYTELLTLENLKRASDLRLEFYRNEQSRIDLLLAQGRATELDRAKINTGLERARYDRLQIDTAYGLNKTLLASLMNADVPNSLLLEKFVIRPDILPANLEEALALARHHHPALLEATAQLDAAESKYRIARSANRPQISAIGNARAMSGGDFSSQEEWQVGVQFSIPLFDGRVKSRSIQQAGIARSQARLTLDNLTNQTHAAITNAWHSVDASRKGITVSRAAYEQAQEALSIETLRYENGRSTLNDLTLAEVALWEATSNTARSENLYELSKAQLLMTMGVLESGSLTASPVRNGK